MDFELFCIQRWFILRDFLRESGIGQCWILDTDILISRPLSAFHDAGKEFGILYTGYSAHACRINRLEELETLCEFMLSVYSDPTWEPRMIAFHKRCVEHSGSSGVSDMTLFHWFHTHGGGSLGSFRDVHPEAAIDLSLEDTEGWVEDPDGFKLLNWRGRDPYGQQLDGGEVRFLAIHHQGRAKTKMAGNAVNLGTLNRAEVPFAKLSGYAYRAIRKLKLVH